MTDAPVLGEHTTIRSTAHRPLVVRPLAVRPLVVALVLLLSLSCQSGSDQAMTPSQPAASAPVAAAPPAMPVAPPAPADLDRALAVGLARFEDDAEGRPTPQPARFEVISRRGGTWHVTTVDDPESNVFHKVMAYDPPDAEPGILTLGGMKAALKLWRHGPDGFTAETLWEKDFGGKWNRMRDAEVGDILGEGRPDIAVATHDQGVVALVSPDGKGGYAVRELDHEPSTFVHEIELGDLDGDGHIEIYATPSEPNRLDGSDQRGHVVRYVPSLDQGRTVVADLGDRHAKEILVADVDMDGRDELYVAVEAKVTADKDANGKPIRSTERIVEGVEIRRYDADTPPDARNVVATLPEDRLTRFLTAGDPDGDGRREIVVAAFKSGLWLLEPAEGDAPWKLVSIDSDSSGFEHVALLTDLDGDGVDELYVASDDQGQLRRYVMQNGRFSRETILERSHPREVITWNLMPVPVALLGEETAGDAAAPPADDAASPRTGAPAGG